LLDLPQPGCSARTCAPAARLCSSCITRQQVPALTLKSHPHSLRQLLPGHPPVVPRLHVPQSQVLCPAARLCASRAQLQRVPLDPTAAAGCRLYCGECGCHDSNKVPQLRQAVAGQGHPAAGACFVCEQSCSAVAAACCTLRYCCQVLQTPVLQKLSRDANNGSMTAMVGCVGGRKTAQAQASLSIVQAQQV
jgi:hypothetical protein